MKKCTICKETQSLEEFHRDRSRGDGLSSRCKTCARKHTKKWAELHPERHKEYYRNNQNKVRNWALLRRYGIGLDDYEQMLEAQQGLCAICGAGGRLFVDHDHQTREIRGLLCPNCNAGLGMFEDSVEFLQNACMYLESPPYSSVVTYP